VMMKDASEGLPFSPFIVFSVLVGVARETLAKEDTQELFPWASEASLRGAVPLTSLRVSTRELRMCASVREQEFSTMLRCCSSLSWIAAL